MSMMDFDDGSFEGVIDRNRIVLVDFYADWCGPCKTMSPIFERLAHKYTGKAVFGRLNVDNAPETASKYQVMSIPTFMLFKSGKPDNAIIGAVPERALEQLITQGI